MPNSRKLISVVAPGSIIMDVYFWFKTLKVRGHIVIHKIEKEFGLPQIENIF